MRYQHLVASVIILSGLCSCAHTPAATQLTPADVVRSSSITSGTRVEVSGVLRFRSHARQLWGSVSSLRRNNAEDCITLIDTEGHSSQLSALNEQAVFITGIVERDVLRDTIDYGACNPVGVRVVSVRGRMR